LFHKIILAVFIPWLWYTRTHHCLYWTTSDERQIKHTLSTFLTFS